MAGSSLKKLTFGRVITLATLLGLVAFLVYIIFSGSIFQIASVLEKTNLLLFSLTFLFVLVSSLFYSLSWRSIMGQLKVSVSIWRAFVFNWAGLLFEITVPSGLAGDLTRAYFTSQYLEKDSGKILASVISQRVLVGVMTAITLTTGLALLSYNYGFMSNVSRYILFTVGGIIVLLFVIIFLSNRPKLTHKIMVDVSSLIFYFRKGNFNRTQFENSSEKILNAYHYGFRVLGSNSKAWIRPVGFYIASWIMEILIFFWVFFVVGFPVSAEKILISYSILALVQGLGSIFEGSAEAAMSATYVLLGIPVDVSIATTVLARLSTFWFKLLFAYGIFYLLGGFRSKKPTLTTPFP